MPSESRPPMSGGRLDALVGGLVGPAFVLVDAGAVAVAPVSSVVSGAVLMGGAGARPATGPVTA